MQSIAGKMPALPGSPRKLGSTVKMMAPRGIRRTRRPRFRKAGSRVPSLRQPTASDALRRSVTSMCDGVWVIAIGGRAERTATWGVMPQAQNTGI